MHNENSNVNVGESAKAAAFPIVGIGASAGGLEAMRQLFSGLPSDTGMAFVVIQHLDPARASMLTAVLANDVHMPTIEVTHGMRVEPNRVHVIPAGTDMTIHQGVLTLAPRQAGKLHLPIDAFFASLAADSTTRAIGVVLSGSASDGTEGLRAIKAAGGITFAQDPESAQFRSMPEHALASGVVDFQAAPQTLASELVRLSRHSYLATSATRERVSTDESTGADDKSTDLTVILAALRKHANLDFNAYKRPTIMRRIARRMALSHCESLGDYARSVRDDAVEAKALARDVLIHVTSFFRDPAAFAALKQRVLPEIIAHKRDNDSLRVWVPGCSSGEEAYSLAMCLIEFSEENQCALPIKIFGSDLSEQAIEAARAGMYTDADVEGVSPQRLAQFFERTEGRHRIGKQVRDLCVFVRHDLTRDPPFAKLDLISCRNVLIYFDADLQRRVLPMFHHCLNKPGYLLLGSSEGIREYAHLFVQVDPEQRLFLKTGDSPRIAYPLALGREAESRLPVFQPTPRAHPSRDAQRQADHILLARYAPPGVVVNERLEVVQFRGRTGDFLEPAPGQPQTNVLKMAREGLAGHLREAIEAAKARSVAVRRKRDWITAEGQTRSVHLEVVPLTVGPTTTESHFLIVFEERGDDGPSDDTRAAARPKLAHPPVTSHLHEEIARLKGELAATRDYLHGIAGEHQDTTEDLGAANEELIAANEELQSTNEELQSAKEELQSTNEELTTLNDELHNGNRQLDLLANDLVNVLESVQIPMIMVDHNLCVRRFTPTAREISSLLPGDVGRSIDDVKLKVKLDDLAPKIRETIQSNTPREHEIQALDGRWFRLHIRPYRTVDNRLDGAVLSFLDVDVLKRAAQAAEHARDYAQGIVDTVPMSLVVLDENLCIKSGNPPFYRSFDMRVNIAEHTELFELADGALDVPALRKATERSLSTQAPFYELEVRCAFPRGGHRDLVVSGCPIHDASGERMLLLALEDVTERHLLEASEKQARTEAEQANRAKDLFLATLSHELRTPLSTILISAQLLQTAGGEDAKIRRASAAIERAVGTQAKLIDDLLDISRIVSGKLLLDLEAVDFAATVQSAVDIAQVSAEAKGIDIEVHISGDLRAVHGDPTRLQQVVGNLLNNAIKFTPRGGQIIARLDAVGDHAQLVVTDTGVGLRPDMIPHLFDRFVQAESSMTRTHGGLGLGLAIVRHIVNVHGGEVHAESPGEGKGSTFTVTLPLAPHDEAAVPTRLPTVSRSVANVHVLLIEDDDDTREACSTMLEQQGATVRTARSTREGLQAVRDFEPAVILCDIAMPGEDGYAFIRTLRDGKHGSTIPAAALTALAGEGDRSRALASGFQMHLAKPIDSERLATAVATLATWPALADAPALAD